MRATTAVVLWLFCMLSASAADRFEHIRGRIRSGLVEQSVPSIAVAVARNGEALWEEGFGWADLERRLPASAHTMYQIASVSKPLTATGIMTLVEAGKLDLDAPANRYLGAAKLRARIGNASDATVRRVANHTSGLPTHNNIFYSDEQGVPSSRQDSILRYANIVTPPGERFVYSNIGYGVLDSIIEHVSGASFADYMRQAVFLPLGMTRTSVGIGAGLDGYTATRYLTLNTQPVPLLISDTPGAGAIFSTAHDLMRFGQFHVKARLRDQKAILGDALLEEMHRAQSRVSGIRRERADVVNYGLGFNLGERYGYRVVSHTGGLPGVSAQLRMLPDQGLVVVVLSNYSSSLTERVADLITHELLPKWGLEQDYSYPAAPEPVVTFALPPQLLGIWQGVLSTPAGDQPLQLRFLTNGEVHARLGEQLMMLVNQPLFRDGEFSGEVPIRIDTPELRAHDHVVTLSLHLRDDVLNGSALATEERDSAGRQRSALSYWVELVKQGAGS